MIRSQRSRACLAALLCLATTPLQAAEGSPAAEVECDRSAVRCRLVVRASRLGEGSPSPRSIQVRELWRFLPGSHRWVDVTPKGAAPIDLPGGGGRVSTAESSRVVFELPGVVGLYRLRWTEGDRRHERDVLVGPTVCNDLALRGAPPAGRYAACWPTAQGATAGYVPSPPDARSASQP